MEDPMTKLEAFEQAALRNGASPKEWQRMLKKIILSGAMPADAREQLPAGTEEAFIKSCILIERRTIELTKTSPEFVASMETYGRKLSRKN